MVTKQDSTVNNLALKVAKYQSTCKSNPGLALGSRTVGLAPALWHLNNSTSHLCSYRGALHAQACYGMRY